MLATGTFTNESTQGWEQLDFTTPVPITAGTDVCGLVLRPEGALRGDTKGLSSAVTNGPLTALASAAASTASTLYGHDAFPTHSWQATNYWVDVVYQPASAESRRR